MSGWWPERIPLRLRVFFRGAFLLLALATVGLAIFELREEKQQIYHGYEQQFDRSVQQITARLQHPSGQLALLNPTWSAAALTPLRPLLLPFAAIDFDDKVRALQAAEMAGCLIQYPAHAQLCVAVGNSVASGGFVYVVGSFDSAPLVGHRVGDPELGRAHRLSVEVRDADQSVRWIAPLELPPSSRASAALNGRLTGFAVDAQGEVQRRPDREFRGWLWQDPRCVDVAAPAQPSGACTRRSFFSVRLPVTALREVIRSGASGSPQALTQIQVHVQALAPGGRTVFDSEQPGAVAPFALSDLKAQLLPGETLRVRSLGGVESGELISLDAEAQPRASSALKDLIAQLPVHPDRRPLAARRLIATPAGEFELLLSGDPRRADSSLTPFAGRLSWLVGAMLLAIVLTWVAIELQIIRRITLLTGRAASLKPSVIAYDSQPLDLRGLQGLDELGLLAQVLAELLQRIHDDAKRERLRVEQEKTMWQAVGHEIMAPLQSLAALHDSSVDPSRRYVDRMRQAVRVLYGGASPNKSFLSASLQVTTLDIQAFLHTVADNAVHAGIERVEFADAGGCRVVKADEHSLEDVITHVLVNADRHRVRETVIRMTLSGESGVAQVRIFNHGPAIAPALLGKIFEYGVSGADGQPSESRRGQGLFVARTYMAKMGGTIEANNVDGGVEFLLRLATA